MAYISLNSDEPGIRGLFLYRPETAGPLNELVEVLLVGDSTLSRGERELIAAYVSSLNECRFCHSTHAAIAAAHLDEGMPLVEQACFNPAAAPVSGKLRTLMDLAGAVQRSGNAVTERHVTAARHAGATDREIHDTVLIAAAFCMFNRYVDGLATYAPADPTVYTERARQAAGYIAGLAELQGQN
jgi:uncharacterized peroxidase-related enzyme